MAKLEGLDEVMKNLNVEINEVEGRTTAGLFAAGLVVQAESQRRVPVEYGVLRASAYTRLSIEDPNSVEVGYTASYALSVHENMEQTLKGQPRPSGIGVYWGPHGQPKFLESAARDKTEEVLEIVAQYANVERKKA